MAKLTEGKKKKPANSSRVFAWYCDDCAKEHEKVSAGVTFSPTKGKCEECDQLDDALAPYHIDAPVTDEAPASKRAHKAADA